MKKTIGIIVAILILAVGGYYIYQQKQTNTDETKDKKEVIKIGAILPLTGGASFIGQSIQEGLTISEKEHKNINIVYGDSKGSPKMAISIYEKLKFNDNIKTFIPVFSSVTNAVVPKSNNKNETFLATCVSSSNITKISDQLFRLFVNANIDARLMARYAYDTLKMRNIYIIYVNDDFGLDYKNTFTDEFNGKIVGVSPYEKGEKNYRNILNKIRKQKEKINGIYILGYDKNFILLLNQYIQNDIGIPILSIGTIAQPNVIKNINLKGTEIYYTTTTLYQDTTSTLKRHFIDEYRKKYNKMPNYFAAFAYDLINIVSECNSEGEELRACLKSKEFEGVMGKIKFDQDGDALFPMVVKKIIYTK